MQDMRFTPDNVCCNQIDAAITEDGRIEHVVFTGGCPGNLQGIAKLIEGMEVQDVIRKLEGIKCGGKDTSCPDQLARALRDRCGKVPHCK